MPQKTKIIFIVVFIIVGTLMIGGYFYFKTSAPSTTPSTDVGYKPFLGSSTTDTTTTGSSNTTTNNSTTGEDTPLSPNNISQGSQEPSKLTQVTDFPVAGATFFEDNRPLPQEEVAADGGPQTATTIPAKKTKTTTKTPTPKFEIVPSLRYVERITGHIDQMYLDTKAKGEVSNSTIPGIYEALFNNNASTVIYRYVSEDGATITSFMATLGGTKGEFLASDITDVSLSPDKTKFFYITKTFGGSVGTIRAFKDTKKTQVFSSSLSEWLTQWVGDQKIYLTTKASSGVNGSVFSLNTTNGVLTKILGGIPGLTTLANKDGSVILYSTSTNSGPRLSLFDVKTRATKDLGIYGLPEKCTWFETTAYCSIPNTISGNQYPDMWYQGLVSFDDHFVKITPGGTQVSTLTTNSDVSIDGTHLFMNKTGDTIFFVNKKDSTLWSLSLN